MTVQVLDAEGAKSFLAKKVKKFTGLDLDMEHVDSSEGDCCINCNLYKIGMDRIKNTDLIGAQDRLDNLLERHENLNGNKICMPKELNYLVVGITNQQNRLDSLKTARSMLLGMVISYIGLAAWYTSIINDSDTAGYLAISALGLGGYLVVGRTLKNCAKGVTQLIKRKFDEVFSAPLTEREAGFADYIFGPAFDHKFKKYPDYRR